LLILSIALGDGADDCGDRGDCDTRVGEAGVSPPSGLIPITEMPEDVGASRMIS
jgi:hypothetical protein